MKISLIITSLLTLILCVGCQKRQYVELETRHKKKYDWDGERIRIGYGQKYKLKSGRVNQIGARVHSFPHANDRVDEVELTFKHEW